MQPELSPFKPGQPVPVEFFVGRTQEIQQLQSMVKASLQGQFKIGFVSGERGIGKSSLVSVLRHVSDRTFETASCHIHLGDVKELNGMVRKIFDRILNESVDKSWHQQVMSFFGDRVNKVGMDLFGFSLELNLEDKQMSMLSHNFVPSMRNLLDQIKSEKKALLLILDDINGLATSTDFANWLKSMVDEIATSQQETPLCILVVGLEERRQELISGQPSLDRVFELINISPWSSKETEEFYRNTFQSMTASIDQEELNRLVLYTGGLPVLAHEIGDAVWRTAQSSNINGQEVNHGISLAANIIGQKLLEPRIFSAIQSEKYHSILRQIAAGEPKIHFTRAELVNQLPPAEVKSLDNFLGRMTNLGAIERIAGIRGGYRFPNFLYALYFYLQSQFAKD